MMNPASLRYGSKMREKKAREKILRARKEEELREEREEEDAKWSSYDEACKSYLEQQALEEEAMDAKFFQVPWNHRLVNRES